ncbi:hypothetical protein [Candidatus Parabeggiatoa sp. HSG14]|uniref:hypothetical protein n=1 Tax=Candidatus Parabeggiatoa sp. HSG14 TaxID=3055593 RepID=UPI0025A7936E|nr:hypothetical protein [Thiotrichales bacterium HSG14]
MTGDLWLAVGDDTGDWNDKQFLGASLVIAKISDWKSVLQEDFKNQTIEQRMKEPLKNLPKENPDSVHHLKDALNYFKKQSVRGLWSLDTMVKETTPLARLKNELCLNLGWLAKHPHLITLCTYGNTEWVKKNLHQKEDYAHVLGQAYGLLLALVIPYFKQDDTLLIAPIPRVPLDISEDSSKKDDTQQTPPSLKLDNYKKSLFSGLLSRTQQSLHVWQRTKMVHYECGTLMDLQKNYFKDSALDIDVLNRIAEISATLLALSQNKQGEIRLHDPNQSWNNVKFFKFEELLA